MDFIILDQELETTYRQLQRRINRLQSGGTIDSIQNIGADTRNQIGASFVSLKKLAENYETNEKLAHLLWRSRKREEQIVACFLLPKIINKEIITQLIESCCSFEIAEYFGSVFLSASAELPGMVTEWMNTDDPFRQIAALTAVARHLIVNKTDSIIPHSLLQEMAEKNYTNQYVRLVAQRYRFNI